jgi:hydroxyacylglutathione hydrolase
MIEIIDIDTPSLGDRGYLATDGSAALVVDAQRDFDRIEQLAAQRGVAITHVFETHMHNDYVTGGLALARAVGAQYVVNGADPVSFDRTPVSDGDLVRVGRMRVRAVATPGHTFTHMSYVLSDGDDVLAAFTGGSLLHGTTGRTDLLGSEHKLALAKAQYGSVHRLASQLPDSAAVCPTHGFGSFCSATPGTGRASTLGEERLVNPALTNSETDYVEQLLAGLDAYPAYYAHMAGANLAGPAAPDLSPPRRADPAELRRRIDAGEWVVDLRSRTGFAAGHLHGAVNFELSDSMASYLGWLIPWGTPLTLVADSPEEIWRAQRDLCRIGIDRIEAAADGSPLNWAAGEPLEAFPCATFEALAARAEAAGFRGSSPGLAPTALVLLDVRLRSEWQNGHIDGALHIPLHELPARLSEIPDGQIWVHCQSGYRSAVAASLLAASGRDVVAINDDFGAAQNAGLRLTADGPKARARLGLSGIRSADMALCRAQPPNRELADGSAPPEPCSVVRQGPRRERGLLHPRLRL